MASATGCRSPMARKYVQACWNIAIRKKERAGLTRGRRERFIVSIALRSRHVVDAVHAERRQSHPVALLHHAGFEQQRIIFFFAEPLGQQFERGVRAAGMHGLLD